VVGDVVGTVVVGCEVTGGVDGSLGEVEPVVVPPLEVSTGVVVLPFEVSTGVVVLSFGGSTGVVLPFDDVEPVVVVLPLVLC
jgi:hypothetical protein